MTINAYGIGPTIGAAKWSKLFQRATEAGAPEAVGTGLAPSLPSGTRLVRIGVGDAVVPGVLAESDTAVDVTLDANTSGQPRIDLVCLRVDWSGSLTTAAQVVTLPGAPGATPTAPVVPRTAGSVWHVPLARVLVRSGVGQIAATDLTDVRPLVRRAGRCKLRQTQRQDFANEVASRLVTMGTVEFDGGGMADLPNSAIVIPYAGIWRILGAVQWRDAANGYRRATITIDGGERRHVAQDANDSTGLGTDVVVEDVFELAAGAVITLRCLHTQGTTTATTASGGYYSMLSVCPA